MRFYRVLVAPDSFKGSLGAKLAAAAIQRGILRATRDIQVTCLPLADGGEGTGDLLLAMGGQCVEAPSRSIYGAGQSGHWVRWGRKALVESAVGSPFAPTETRTGDGEDTTSFGTGLLAWAALHDAGVDAVYVALGGTGSTDGGMGFMAALGARFLDENGRELEPTGANLGSVAECVPPPSLPKPVIGLYDVGVPLLGDRGAVRLFGPQKGIVAERLDVVESGMSHFVEVMGSRHIADMPGAGAAGGIGFGILAIGGTLVSGAEMVAAWCQLDQHVAAADVVITGEGRIDEQTLEGKVVGHVVKEAHRQEKPVIAVVGSRAGDLSELHRAGLSFVMPLVSGPMALAEAIERTQDLLVTAGEELGFLIAQMGGDGGEIGP